MKKSVFKNCDFETLIETHNPFGIKAMDGSIQFFSNYTEVYLYVLNILFHQFGRGYVDLILLVNVLTGLRAGVCEEVFRSMKSIWGTSPERLIEYDWDCCTASGNRDTADILKCLHTITETKYDEQAFTKALELFRIKLVKEGYVDL